MKTPIAPPEFAHFLTEWHFSPAIEASGFVFFSGISGVKADGEMSSDPESQIRDAFDIAARHLEAAGLNFDAVVEMTSYHVDLRTHLDTFTRVKDAYVDTPYPAWTAVGVSELITPGTIIELRLIAQSAVHDD